MSPPRVIVVLFLCFIPFPGAAFLHQYVGVRGRLLCGKTPLPDALVKLWDNNFFGSDTKLGETSTNKSGAFQIEGGKSALLTMDVHLKIYHHCNDKPTCQRMVDLQVPSDYVFRGRGLLRWFAAGSLDMAFRYPNEQLLCVN